MLPKTITDCNFSVTIRGIKYDFLDINSISIEDPETTERIRGASGKNVHGLVFKANKAQPKTVSMSGLIESELLSLLNDVYEKKEEIDFLLYDPRDGSSISFLYCTLNKKIRQESIDDSGESMFLNLIFNTFEIKEA